MSSGKVEFNSNTKINKVDSVGFLPNSSFEQDYNENIEITELKSLNCISIINDYSNYGFPAVKKNIEEFYYKALKIHLILLNNDNLTNNQKLNYCKLGRTYMKLYLKEIVKKNFI